MLQLRCDDCSACALMSVLLIDVCVAGLHVSAVTCFVN
jgi:hypothetical protein